MLKKIFSIFLLIFSTHVFAKETNLYDQPKTDAKVVATVDLSAGVIPIFTPKNSEWIKVADPRNGNVGWMKSSELSNTNTFQSSFTIKQEGPHKTPMQYRVIQLGQSTLNPEQTKALEKQIQMQQQALQQSIQNMMKNMNTVFKNDSFFSNQPIIMPVVILPMQQKPVDNKPAQP